VEAEKEINQRDNYFFTCTMAHATQELPHAQSEHAQQPAHKKEDFSELKQKYLVPHYDPKKYWPYNRNPTTSTSLFAVLVYGGTGALLVNTFTKFEGKSPRLHHFHCFSAFTVLGALGYYFNYQATQRDWKGEYEAIAKANKEKAFAKAEEKKKKLHEEEEKRKQYKAAKEAKKEKKEEH